MRLFFSITPPEEVIQVLERAQKTLRLRSACRLVPGGRMHLTLHFLGELQDGEEVALRLREAVRGLTVTKLEN